MTGNREDWRGSRVVFILELVWNKRVFHASTEPIQVPSNQGDISFHGGLVEQPEINLQLPELGFQVDSYNTPIAVYLNDVDVSKQASKHNYLDDADAVLSFILVKGDQVSSYEDRVELISGKVKQPFYGHKDKSKGYVEFSIENQVIDSSMYKLLVGSNAVISSLELSAKLNASASPFSSIFIAGTELIDVIGVQKGKLLPFIIGQAGFFYDEENNKQYFGATPAYVIHAKHGGTNEIWLGIAGHEVEATNVRIYDDLGNWRLETVEQYVRRDGEIFSYVHFTHGAGGFQNPVDDESARFFVSWINGGGFKSILTNADLSNGGDLCLYMLSLGGQKVDFEAWNHIRTLLNAYKFAGYITEFDITPLEFLQNEVIPFLPISIVQGVEGLKPVFNVLGSGAYLLAVDTITANQEFYRASPIQSIDDVSELINDYTLEYVYDEKENQHRRNIRITGESKDLYQNVTSNLQAVESFQRYGIKSKMERSNFIHDDDTAALVAFDKIRFHSLPSRVIEYITSPNYGYLRIGDIIRLTDPEVFLTSRLVQVISKSYQSNSWSYTFKIAPEGIQP
jgi:hypothetical protein